MHSYVYSSTANLQSLPGLSELAHNLTQYQGEWECHKCPQLCKMVRNPLCVQVSWSRVYMLLQYMSGIANQSGKHGHTTPVKLPVVCLRAAMFRLDSME